MLPKQLKRRLNQRNKMAEITAQLNSYRQSPRKVRLVANAIKGKSVKEAKIKLDFIIKRSAGPLHKLLNSAVANAKNMGLDTGNLLVKSVTVNGGQILHRRRPVSRGMAHPINKRTSRVKMILAEKVQVSNEKDKNK